MTASGAQTRLADQVAENLADFTLLNADALLDRKLVKRRRAWRLAMFMSADDLALDGDYLDLSFEEGASDGWPRHPRSDLSVLMFAIGDPERGPIVGLFRMPGKPGDEEKFPPIVHMHRSDSFRTIYNSDFYVGRKLYANGDARLQRGGRYYGPEQLGVSCCKNSETTWAVLVFADKRGHKVQPVDEKYIEMVAAGDAAAEAKYRKLGVVPFAQEDRGQSDIRTNIGVKIAGHGDLSFRNAGAWPMLGGARTVAIGLGEADCGPLVFGLAAGPGKTILPAAAWDTEVLTVVTRGSCEIGGESYAPGRLRVQKAGVAQPALVAGSEGMEGYVVIGDRRASPATAAGDTEAAAWARALADETATFSAPKAAAA